MGRSTLTTAELAAYLRGRLDFLIRAGLCPRCAIRLIALDDRLPLGTVEALLGEFDADWVTAR